jgi:hypothetical protein
MARVRQQTAAPAQPTRRRRAVNVEAMRTAADDFLTRFGGLVDEVVSLREALAEAQEENAQLRAELAEGIDLFRDARALVDQAEPTRRRRGGGTARSRAAPARATAPRGRSRAAASRNGAGAGRAARAAGNGRATPASVTADVVRAVIGKLGTATAGEIAAQISEAGTPVSGRAIRHIAKGAGAVMRPGDDGRMVYSLS